MLQHVFTKAVLVSLCFAYMPHYPIVTIAVYNYMSLYFMLPSSCLLYANKSCEANIDGDVATIKCDAEIAENARRAIIDDAKKYINLKDIKFSTISTNKKEE